MSTASVVRAPRGRRRRWWRCWRRSSSRSRSPVPRRRVRAAAPSAAGYNLYFGDLHAHTGYSDGASGTTPWDAFPVGRDSGADFMALTEHYSTSNAYEAWTMDELEWLDLKKAAAYFTSSSFVAMPAYEFYLVAHSGEFNVFNVSELPPKMEILGPERLGLFYDWLSLSGPAASASSTTPPTSPTSSTTSPARALPGMPASGCSRSTTTASPRKATSRPSTRAGT